MRSLFLVLALSASLAARAQGSSGLVPYEPPPRALTNEIHSQVGLLTGGYSFGGGSWNDLYAATFTGGHYLFHGFTVEAGLLSLTPLEGGGPGWSASLSVRLGYTGERWNVLAGPVVQAAYPSTPLVTVLPSLKGLYRLEKVSLEAGVLDMAGLVPAHVGVSYGPVSLAYVLPLGARAAARIPLSARVGIQVDGFAFRLGSAHSAMLILGLVGNPPSSRPGGKS
ncbi:hypothetical protein [Hyalangium versicolor]|uniref:hypothetical protein n=1 Tax=Hyalangium versicolor TaxID=2861190 RepID=UPI001CCC9CBF|nr:hypothetical protein [Hyalangium versicolor]